MRQIDYKNSQAGNEIMFAIARSETGSFEAVAKCRFFKTVIEGLNFQPPGKLGFLKIFAGNGETRRRNYVLQNGAIRSTAVVEVRALNEKAEMLCLHERPHEIAAAHGRSLPPVEDFEPCERDTFHVKNLMPRTEHHAALK